MCTSLLRVLSLVSRLQHCLYEVQSVYAVVTCEIEH